MSHDKMFCLAGLLTALFPVLLIWPVPADIAICAIAALFLAHCFMRGDWSWAQEKWAQLLLLLWAYMVARGLVADHPWDALGRALPFGRYIVFAAALAHWTLRDEPTRRHMLFVLSGVVVACALDGLLQYFTGHDLLRHKLIHDHGTGPIRLDGPFARPILGIMLAWLSFPALLPILRERGRIFALACILAVTAAIALSGERMALLLTLFGWLLAGLMLRPRRGVLLMGLAGLLLLIGALAFALPGVMKRQVESTEQTLAHWQQSPYGILLASDLRVAAEHPIVGVGANQFRAHCTALYAKGEPRILDLCNTHPHNFYLEWLIEEGLIGLTLFVLFVACVLERCARAFSYNDAAFAGFVIAFVLRVWPFMSTTDFASRWGAPPFWLVLGALLVYTGGRRDKKC